MAVRFLPPSDAEHPRQTEDRGDLAEVIELRSQLRRPDRVAAASPEAAEPRTGVEPTVSQDRADSEATMGTRPIVRADFGGVASLLQTSREESAATETASVPDLDDEPEKPMRTAHEDGVRVLGRRARSSGELRAELMRLEHDADEIETVIDEFTRSLYLDDLGLARTLTEKLRDTKGASRSQIRVKLRARKLPDDAIEAALGELDVDQEFELMRETAKQRAAKLGGLEHQVAERRLLGFLARRGWSGEPAMRAAREALEGSGRASRGSRGGSGVRFH